jgi:hypothetical protein
MAQNTNLNIAPYFDDFDSDKGFLKVLFKPGYPVQARELTTLQSILQNQIDSFGQGVYKEGSMVIPGGITLNTELPSVLIQNTYLNLDVELYRTALDGKIVKGSTSGVRARVNFSISAATSDRGNITFYLTYLQKANDNTTTTFTNGEVLTCEEDITYQSTTISAGTPLAQLLNSNSNSVGSTANISAGVYFVRGYFVPVLQQTLILDQYGTTPTYKVGLKVEERLITADEDETLYDNAIGSTNFSAPGADRFKINLTLVKKNVTDPNSADFIELLRTDTGNVKKKVVRSDLGFINEVLANRTKEESGDYYVKKFTVDVRENLDDGFNNGVFASGATTPDGNVASEENVSIQLSSGVAYISGFRTERQSTSYKDVEKPRTFVGKDSQSISSSFGNYLVVDNAYQAPSLYETIELRDERNVTPGTASGTVIGKTRVYGFSYEDGTRDTSETLYRVNVADTTLYTKLTTNSVTWTAGNLITGATSGAKGYIASGSGTTGYVYGVTGTFAQAETLLNSNGSTFATSTAAYAYTFTDVKQLAGGGFTADVQLDVKVALPGSGPILSGVSGGNATITATLSNFLSQLRINDIIEFSNNNESHKAKVTAITDNYNFNITRLGSTTLANGAVTSPLVRTRPEIKETNRRSLLTSIGQSTIKNTNKNNTIAPSGFFRQSYTGISVSSGSFSLTAGTGLTFRDATDADDFIVVVTAGGGTMPTGTIVTYGGSLTFSAASGSQSSVTVSGLDNAVTAVEVIATVFQSDRSAKVKTTERMKILKIDDTTGSAINGLTQATSGYGYRVEDGEISLGCADVFRIKAILEAKDNQDPVIPNFQYTNLTGTLQIDEIITGVISGSRARVVSTDSNYVYFIPVNDDKFSDGENITGPNSSLKIVTGSVNLGSKDITDNYTLDNGQRDQYYDYSRIVRKQGYTAPTHRIFVIFDRFLTTSGTGFYTVDSYPDSEYKEIPSYNGVELRDVIDFRPIVPTNLTGSGSRTSPFTLTSGGKFDFNNRVFTGNLVGLPGQSDSTIISYEHYLGRIDKVFLNKDNVVQIIKGSPSESLAQPEDIDDAMLLATITYQPYVFDVDRDVSIVETNFRRYTFRDIQRLDERIKNLEYYTQLSLLESETANMTVRDTNGLDRFKNGFIVDNFASLSTSDTLHPDYRVSLDFERGELRPAHYTTQVPLVYSTGSLNVKQTGDVVTLPYTDKLLLEQSYASGVENVNPFNVFTYIGDIKLYPESDNWVDTKTLSPLKGPTLEGNFLTTVREYNADQNGFAPVQWNAWQTTWTGTSTSTSESRSGGGGKGGGRQEIRTTTTTTTTTRQTRTGIRFRVTPVIEQQSLGNRIVSVEHINFMRSRNIEFTVKKLKPRTKFFAFFDGIAVATANITPKVIGLTKDSALDSQTNNIPFQIGETITTKDANGNFRFKARVVAPNEGYNINPIDGSDISALNDYTSNLGFVNIDTKALADQAKGSYYGSPKINDYIVGETSGAIAKVVDKSLITDGSGNLKGSFFISDPNVAGNQKFKTGTRLFRLTDQGDDTRVSGVSDSSGEAEFTSSGILQTQQETIISVRNARITSEEMRQERTLVSTSSSTQTRFVDPLAQTFLVDEAGLEGGVYLSKVDLFFQTKDSEIPVSLDIRVVENGTPTQIIVPFSKVIKEPSEVFVSDNASTPTTFTFESPVYIPYRSEFALVLTSDSNNYKTFISILGQDAIDAAHAGEKISEQPYIGVLFKSQNASTWTPSQYEDLMFKIYRCQFTLPNTSSPSRLILENAQLGEGNGGFLRLLPNTFQLTSGSDQIRVFHSNHGMQSALNYVKVSNVISEVADTAVNMPGGFGTTSSQLTVDDASDFHTTIGGSAVSSANPGFVRILGTDEDGSGDEIIAYEAINGNVLDVVGHGVGTVTGRNWTNGSGSATGLAHADNAVVECYNLAGIPLTLINTTHSSSTGGIISINSPHSYNLQISGKTSGKSISAGGPNITVSQNIPWDVLTPQIQSQVQPETSLIARVLGTSGTSCGPFPSGVTAETSFVKDTTYTEVTLGEINYFTSTKLVASELNEINNMNSTKSFTMEIEMLSDRDNLSPVIDLEKCSIVTTANVYNNATPSKTIGGECVANYITRLARLDKSATALRAMLSGNTFTQSNIVVMYKLVPVGFGGNVDDLDFEFFNTDGRPDSGAILAQNDPGLFEDFEYTIDDAANFDAFQIKISLVGYQQPYIPRVKDLRIIALA